MQEKMKNKIAKLPGIPDITTMYKIMHRMVANEKRNPCYISGFRFLFVTDNFCVMLT